MTDIVCSGCKYTVEKCDYCGHQFSLGDEIVCLNGDYHFCDFNCLDDWVNKHSVHTQVTEYTEM